MFLFKPKRSEHPKVSVVVPCYNVEKYLPECLESLCKQSLKDIEIICVNDGSTDGTLGILRDFESRDPRIVVIDKPNSGYGHTMNTGFAKARGEYIGITESDDFASRDMFKTLYDFAKKHDLDLVKSNYYEHTDNGDVKMEPYAKYEYRRVFDPRVEQDVLTVLPIIWAGLYRRQMLVDEGIRFNETPGASYQDTSFVHQVWCSARRVALLPGAYLHYRVDNANSSVKSSSKIYEVCGEYALTREFLLRDPERYQAFAPIMNLLKLGTYRWNFNRIADEHRRGFAEKMAEEYRSAAEEGTLDKSYFSPEDWEMLTLLMEDIDRFMERYGSAM